MIIGNLDIGNKLIMAPMAEVTDSSFRKICKENGSGLTFTQMVSADGVVKNNFDTLRYLSFNKSEKPVGVQVLGNNPDILAEATKEISKLKPDLIDFNCGCPADKVINNKMGSALLEDPKTISKIIRRMADNSNGVPISVKLRLGKDKSRINIFDTVKAVEDNGGSLIFLHARTRVDRYDTDPDWSWIAKVKEKSQIAIAGNGSVFTPQDAKRMIDETGCDCVMVARGALGNPFIFSRYNNLVETGVDSGMPDIELVKQTLLKHINLLVSEFGEFNALEKAKKHAIWYLRNYAGIDLFVNKVLSQKNIESLIKMIEDHFGNEMQNESSESDQKEINQKFKRKVLFWLPDENSVALG